MGRRRRAVIPGFQAGSSFEHFLQRGSMFCPYFRNPNPARNSWYLQLFHTAALSVSKAFPMRQSGAPQHGLTVPSQSTCMVL